MAGPAFSAPNWPSGVETFDVESIRDIDISPGLFSRGSWKKKLFEVEGEMVSLDDIEHRILRPIWKDPRIHYAVNCASIRCPDLMSAAFTANNAEKLLNEGARRCVSLSHPYRPSTTIVMTGR